MAVVGYDEYGNPVYAQDGPAVAGDNNVTNAMAQLWAKMAQGGSTNINQTGKGESIGGYIQNPTRNPTNWTQQALQRGAGALTTNQYGDVTGFNYGEMGVDEEGMSEAEKIASLDASLQAAALAAQLQDSNAGLQELRSMKGEIFNSPSYKTYTGVVNSALAEGEQLPTNDYANRAAPVNAWARRELDKNKNVMANSGLGGSELGANRASMINLQRGSLLGAAKSDSDERVRKAKVEEQTRRSGLARGMFSDTATPTMSIANSLANLKANRNYGRGSVNW